MVEGLEAVEEVANWIRKNGCNSHRSFWRRFRFSFRAYSFLQQLRLMRRKRCSRPSLKESTSGRCNYDLACYFSFLFPTSIFPPPSSFRFSSSLLPFLTPPTREGDERLFNENGEMSFRAWQWNSRQNLVVVASKLSLSLFLLSVFLSLLEREEVKLFDVRFPFTLALGFFPRRRFSVTNFCRVFEFSKSRP